MAGLEWRLVRWQIDGRQHVYTWSEIRAGGCCLGMMELPRNPQSLQSRLISHNSLEILNGALETIDWARREHGDDHEFGERSA